MRAGLQVTARALVAEALGTALLVAAVVGSGIMAQRLGADPAVVLLCNTVATGGALFAILLMLGPVSGAQLNPAVTVSLAFLRELPAGRAMRYVVAQIAGGCLGTAMAHAMFEQPLVSLSTTARVGAGQLLSEGVATFGLLGVVIGVGRSRPSATPAAVAAYIVAAYWFTASTSFANPAVTVARALSDTYAGIRPADVPAFLLAQGIGAATGTLLFSWLIPVTPPMPPVVKQVQQ